ncbi:Glycine oxidase [Rubrobacter xylanophilus DSM 9941]|uniref:NAD(P)/FAD-dependent oxidoreductase n=1 Tax=Rubrobacter xylanophilus TaxID=49319 RepID=UPI001C64287A|nr:FAD-dependent oxidoreductase [Rubrobacter xylanophilus]QYJ16415.1 Glycine oxidase [Rubrobacter xylanophilus DSM 9941]
MSRIVVVGAGVVGASAAYHLARAGAETVLVEGDLPGQATAAGAGIVCPALRFDAPEAWRALAFPAVGHYPELLDTLAADGEGDTGYETVGTLLVAGDDRERAALGEAAQRLEELRRAGVANVGEVRALAAGEPRELFPFLSDDLPGLHLSGAARVDGRRLRDALERAARRRGARVVRGTAALLLGDGRVRGVRVGGEETPADAVVAAAGAWTGELCRPAGLRVPVYPQRGQIAHLRVPGADTSRLPIVEGFRRHYMLAFPGERVVAGATREDGAGFDRRVTAGGVHEVLSEALRLAPGLSDATLAEVRVGFRPASPDGLPSLGEALPGLVVATGLGPSGLTIGPYAGRLAAELALGERPALDLEPYAPHRRPSRVPGGGW